MVKIAKKSAQDPTDPSLQMKIRQYIVLGRRHPSEKEPNPTVLALRVFAQNKVVAKSKFWYHMRAQQKLKSAQGQILSIHEIFEKRPNFVKTYGVVLKYQSRTGQHNMYKEFRDTSVNGAISQLYMEMSGNHRANHDTVHVIRTNVLNKKADVRRGKSIAYRDSKVRFPVVKTIARASQKKFRTVFKASRPNTYKS